MLFYFGVGKAFCSRKTAPTLKPLCKSVHYNKTHPEKGVCFIVVETKGLEPLTSRM